MYTWYIFFVFVNFLSLLLTFSKKKKKANKSHFLFLFPTEAVNSEIFAVGYLEGCLDVVIKKHLHNFMLSVITATTVISWVLTLCQAVVLELYLFMQQISKTSHLLSTILDVQNISVIENKEPCCHGSYIMVGVPDDKQA